MKRSAFIKLYCLKCEAWCLAEVRAKRMRVSEAVMTRYDASAEAKKLWRKLGLQRLTAKEIREALAKRFGGVE